MYDSIYALVSLKVIARTSDESRGINDPSYLAPASYFSSDTRFDRFFSLVTRPSARAAPYLQQQDS